MTNKIKILNFCIEYSSRWPGCVVQRPGGAQRPALRHHAAAVDLEPGPLHGPPPAHRGPPSEQVRDVSTNTFLYIQIHSCLSCQRDMSHNRYITVGCGAMKLILKNFGSVIKTNIDSPVTMGVDISREERWVKLQIRLAPRYCTLAKAFYPTFAIFRLWY